MDFQLFLHKALYLAVDEYSTFFHLIVIRVLVYWCVFFSSAFHLAYLS